MGTFRIIKNEYYDIYYDESKPNEVARAEKIRNKLIKRGFHLSDTDGHINKVVCDQMLRTKAPKV